MQQHQGVNLPPPVTSPLKSIIGGQHDSSHYISG
nr:MAG TPA: hypothetical protein [Caudoviricetes sp.]